MSLTHKSVKMEFPLHRSLTVTVGETNFFKDGGTLPVRGTRYDSAEWKTFFGADYRKEFSNYFFCWNIDDTKDGGSLLFTENPPTLAEQAAYNFQYVEDGANPGDEWPRLMQRFYMLRDDYVGGSPPIYQKGMTVPGPPASTGTGWVRTGEKEHDPDDSRISSVFVILDVYYSATAQTRTDYVQNPETGTFTEVTTSWVSPSDVPVFELGKDKSQKQISALWSLRTVQTAADFTSYHIQTATRVSLQIPDELIDVAIVWAESFGESTSASEWNGDAYGSFTLSGSENGRADSSVSLIPDILPNIRSYWAKNLPATTHFFIVQSTNVTEADILAKVGGGCIAWPVFKPISSVISLVGEKRSLSVSASCNATASTGSLGTSFSKTQGTGQGIDVSNTHSTRTIPACIHGVINFTGDATRTIPIDATADAQWTGSSGFPSSTAYKTASTSAYAEVTPVTLAATSPSAVPTGDQLYLIEYTSKPFQKWFGYMMVQAQVFNSNVLA